MFTELSDIYTMNNAGCGMDAYRPLPVAMSEKNGLSSAITTKGTAFSEGACVE